jgi:dephospho-CoA kinase
MNNSKHSNFSKVTLIAVCGLGGSGKSTLGEYLSSNLNIPHYHIGQVLLDECKKMNIEPTRENGKILGKKLGIIDNEKPFLFFNLSYHYMRSLYAPNQLVFFDAIRSVAELDYLKVREKTLLVGVYTNKEERYIRLFNRSSQNRRTMTEQQIIERDMKELGLSFDEKSDFNVGALLGLSDFLVITTKEDSRFDTYKKLVEFISSIKH